MSMNLSLALDKISKTETKKVEGEKFSATYSFYELALSGGEVYYAVEISDEDDSDLAIIGKDHSRALSLYELLVDMEASACTLQDIVSDNFRETKY